MGLLFIVHLIYEYGEQWWNVIDKEESMSSERNLFQCHFVHQTSHTDDPGANPGRRGEKPATNRLSRGTRYEINNKDKT
jgi:hypothetical protein